MSNALPPPTIGTPDVHEDDIARQVARLPEFQLAQVATSVLAVVADDASEIPVPAEYAARQHRTAVTVAAIRAFRALRAGMAIVSRGYALEADAMTRVMVELYIAATEVLAEPSGQEAHRWLTRGMGKKIKARVDARVPQPGGVYGPLSRAAHGDPRAVLSMVTVTGRDPAVEWGPAFTPRIADVLRGYAVGARDFAVLLEQVTGRPRLEVERLDEVLVAAIPGFDPAKDWSAQG